MIDCGYQNGFRSIVCNGVVGEVIQVVTALITWFVEIAKGIGGDRLAVWIEPRCKQLFGPHLGHDVSVAVSTTVVLVALSLGAFLVTREGIRWLRAWPVIIAAFYRHRTGREKHLTI